MSEKLIVSKGLDDIIVKDSRISFVDGARGKLIYQGFDIDVLAKFSNFEEVAYVIWYGDLPIKEQLDGLKQQLKASRTLPKEVIDVLRRLPKTTHPMDALRTGVSTLASFDPELEDNSREANLRKSIRLTAKFPTVLAAFSRIREGKEPVPPYSKLDHSANFLYMLSGREPDNLSTRVMDVALILHMEHEMNASAFACTVTISTLADIYSAIVSGIGTLRGPLHGGANEAALKVLTKIGTPAKAEEYVLTTLKEKRKMPGFGHRVYKAYDPRAKIFKDYVRELSGLKGARNLYDIAVKVEEVMSRELGEAKGIFPNIDFYSGITYHLMGIPTDLFTPIFAVSRVVGWCAHVIEYLADNRLVRPRANYIGPLDREYIPIDRRPPPAPKEEKAVVTVPGT